MCKQSEQGGDSKRVSGASEEAYGRASGPVFLVILDHSGMEEIKAVSFFTGSAVAGVTVSKISLRGDEEIYMYNQFVYIEN